MAFTFICAGVINYQSDPVTLKQIEKCTIKLTLWRVSKDMTEHCESHLQQFPSKIPVYTLHVPHNHYRDDSRVSTTVSTVENLWRCIFFPKIL